MTAVEKAKELVDNYIIFIREADMYEYLDPEDGLDLAKQCALIALDEIMKAPFENSYLELVPDDAPDSNWYWDKFREYWNKVKQELNNKKIR